MDKEYPACFITNLAKLYDDMDASYPDMTLQCMEDGTKLKCHRVILAASSEYFKNNFGWSESDTLEIHNGINGVIMELVLKFIYSGKVSLTLDNVNDVLVAGNFFGLSPIVKLCIDMLLDNLSVDTCIEMLLLSWQLDLQKLTECVVTYVATNFSEISHDIERLSSLPLQLMAMVLGSNDLVIRQRKTNLPTVPAEREKRVLDFILFYTNNADHCSDEGFDLLLSCVKWQFLDIFREKEYALTKFATLLDHGQRVEEVKKRLNSWQHSPWFLQSFFSESNRIAPSDEDKAIYGTRAFSCAELIWSTPTMGTSRPKRISDIFKMVIDAHEHISRIDLISQVWACQTVGHDINVLGGLKIHVTSPDKTVVCHHYGISEEDGNATHTIQLSNGEHITAVYGRSGGLVDQLAFETSNSNPFGPFLGEGGTERDLMCSVTTFREEGKVREPHTSKVRHSVAQAPHSRIPLDAILVGVSGVSVRTSNVDVISQLQFGFRLMVPGSAFLISSERKCVREATMTTCEAMAERWL